jgi:phage gpG-like protein
MNLDHIFQQIADPICQRIDRSIQLNFRNEGRPDKWKKSHRAEILNELTLTDSAVLKNSIKVQFKDQKFIAGSNVEYARIHQEGGTINKSVTVKAHKRKINLAWGRLISEREVDVAQHSRQMNITIQARQYMMLQDADRSYIKRKIETVTERLFRDYKPSSK